MPQASIPSPRTWASGDLVTVPRLRADAVDAVAFLLARPAFAAVPQAARGLASGSDTAIALDSELLDNWGGHVIVTTNGATSAQYWAPVPGWYLCRSAPAFNYTSSTQAAFAGSLEGVTGGVAWGPARGPLVLCGSTSPPIAQCVDLVQMTASGSPGGSGDWVQFDAFQSSGSTVNYVHNATFFPAASARWVCAASGTQPLPVPPLAAAPSPLTSAWLNGNVRDAIRFLAYPPVCKAGYVAGSSTLASGAFPAGNAVPLNSAVIDNYGGFNATTHQYTAPVAGRYLVAGQFNLAASAATTAYCCGVQVSGGTIQWGDSVFKVSDTTGGGAQFARRMRLAAGDTVQLMGCQGSGSAIAYSASGVNPTRMIIVWEGI